MAPGPADLFNLAVEYLAACEVAVAASPGGPIERVFVSPGPPAWDSCEQLTVHAGGPVEGDTAPLQPPLAAGHREASYGAVRLVNLTATVLRCVPGMDDNQDPPAAADLHAAALVTLSDVWAIWNHCANELRKGSLFASPSGSREVFFDPAVSLNVQGNVAGWQVGIRVQLGGYREP